MRRLKIGTVPYLNIEPFLWALQEVVPCEFLRCHPSGLLSLLKTTELDACMLSAVDFLAEDIEPLRGASISSDGAVKSVLLMAERGPSSWNQVALDSNSRTSNELARLLAETLFDGARSYQLFDDPLKHLKSDACDAAVLIGDRALCAEKSRFVFDLGDLWKDLTGLPFVYAAWARCARQTVSLETLEAIFAEARRTSHCFIDRCVSHLNTRSRLEPGRVREYLRQNISYEFGYREREGLREFGNRLRSRSMRNEECVRAAAEDELCGGRQ